MTIWPVTAVLACVLLITPSARGDSAFNDECPIQVQISDALKRITDPEGLRSRLEQAGVQLTFTYYGDALANPYGGVKQGAGYDGRFGTIADADLEKLIGWSGAVFHASIHEIHGSSFSAGHIDSLMTVSGIEAPPAIRLFNLWIEQKLDTGTSLRLGQFTAQQEFMVSRNADLFVNNTFGWPVLPAVDLPSGGPAYPEATPGARLAFTPDDRLTLRAAIFNGDPAGPGPGNPVERDPYGLAFRVNDPPLLIAELAYAYNKEKQAPSTTGPQQEGAAEPGAARQDFETQAEGADLPGTVKAGAWLHTGLFPVRQFNAQGDLLAMPGAQPQRAGDFALYGIIDQMLWRAGSRSLSFFARVEAAPAARNRIDRYLDTGLTLKSPIAGRPDDIAGIAFAFARISPDALASEALPPGSMPVPVPNFEAAIELTYRVAIADQWYLQPDLQYIIHPAGQLSNGGFPASPSAVPNTLVLGMRTVLKF